MATAPFLAGKLTAQSLALTPAVTPAALAIGTTNDYNPAGLSTTSRIRQATNAGNSALSGLVAQTDGTIRVIENLGSGTLTFLNENAGSAAANRFTLPAGADLGLPSGGTLTIYYDLGTTRWHAVAQTTSGGTVTFSSVTTQAFALTPAITPAALGSVTVPDYNPAGLATTTRIRQAGALATTISGLVAQSDGAIRVFENIGTDDLFFAHENGGSTAANRFSLPGSTGQQIAPNGTIWFVYDATLSRWVAFAIANFLPQVTAFQEISFTPAQTPAALAAGATNNYNPANLATTTVFRQAVNAAGSTLTGIVAQNDGDIRVLENLGPANLILTHEDAGSTAANRFTLPGDGQVTLAPDCTIQLIYDIATARWRVLGEATNASQALTITPAVSPGALVAGNTNNYNPTGLSTTTRVRATPDAGGTSAITGLVAQRDGDIRIIQNLSAATILTLSNEDAASTAANRFTLPGGTNLVIGPSGSTALIYDSVSSRWMALDKAASQTAIITNLFGTGSDGSVVFDGVATILGMVPVANVYTMTRSIGVLNMTVNTGVTVFVAGWSILVAGTLSMAGTAKISGDGITAVGRFGAAAPWPNTAMLGNGAAGITAGTGNGSNGGVPTSGSPTRLHATGALPGVATGVVGTTGGTCQGGVGGGSGIVGLTSGGVVAFGTVPANQGDVTDWIGLAIGRTPSGATIFCGGSAGGTGAGDSVLPAFAGGSGSGAGWVVVRARNITSGGSITANGGGGGASSGGNAGGGAGGGGGVVVCIAGSGTIPPLTALGGPLGAGTGLGKNGGAGGPGLTFGIVL